ncbi:cytochrome c biogenesis heme-transporting ATPase CcmA [Catenovulum sp. SM1970]|uniref:cytochrome c biogenesis heme-transporting ATPase CcmA n=1 Tax=Marinifaba aquimaris TaxID=2741323 RepID=UPI0015739FA6|nr:cytochrome c biogenesis heme-transporting ATPase CcmA [Marinifaba aquimaris]NTS76367.1 cytochrome c biogenesis heme-transporting ATPase CcmA [Marinifaba aquimaris]
MLSVQQLTCIRNNRVLFEDLSFQLEAGQLMYLTGPNGAGKTTLLRSVCGLHQVQSGLVSLNGQPISEQLSQVLYIGHKPGVNEWLNAEQNIAHWLTLTNQQADIQTLVSKVGLTGLGHVPVRYLSAGQKRRVALVRLWVSKAKLWVLDEPYTSIDQKGIEVLNALFDRHKKAGNHVLVTSHQALPTDMVDINFNLEYRF